MPDTSANKNDQTAIKTKGRRISQKDTQLVVGKTKNMKTPNSKSEEGRKSKSKGNKDSPEGKTLAVQQSSEQDATIKKSKSGTLPKDSARVLSTTEVSETADQSPKSRRSKKSFRSKNASTQSVPTINAASIERGKQITKLCTEIAQEILEESAEIFTTRFYHHNKNLRIIMELRDTWHRILESESMEFNIAAQELLPSDILKLSYDIQPPRLDNDSWARGTLEDFPHQKRESVVDPSIRRKILGGIIMTSGGRSESVKSISTTPSLTSLVDTAVSPKGKLSSSGSKTSNNVISKEKLLDSRSHSASSKLKIDNENDTQSKHSLFGDGDARTPASSLQDILSPSLLPDETVESAEEKEIKLLKRAVRLASSISNIGLKPWTISKSGIQNQTGGVYKLFRQTTSEAIRAMTNDNELQKMEKNASHRTQSESDLNLNIVEIIVVDGPGTQTLNENTAALVEDENKNTSEQSEVHSESNMVAANDRLPGLNPAILPLEGETKEQIIGTRRNLNFKDEVDQITLNETADNVDHTEGSVDFITEIHTTKIQKDQAQKRKTISHKRFVEDVPSNDDLPIENIRNDQAQKRKTVTQKRFVDDIPSNDEMPTVNTQKDRSLKRKTVTQKRFVDDVPSNDEMPIANIQKDQSLKRKTVTQKRFVEGVPSNDELPIVNIQKDRSLKRKTVSQKRFVDNDPH